MSFRLGNHTIDEILQAVATNFADTEIYYTVDQLSSASIAITSDPREITDKNGNVVRRIYKTKNGEFTSTNAMLHPVIMNAASGSSIEEATQANPIDMPKIAIVLAGGTLDVSDAAFPATGTIADANFKVIGLDGDGANSAPLTQGTSTTPTAGTFGVVTGQDNKTTLYVPAAATGEPVKYVVAYTRSKDSGLKLTNDVEHFPSAVRLTLLVSYVDLCEEKLRPAYVVIPSFMADPSITINLSSDNQEMDFNGALQVDYCSGNKALYYIYYPDEDLVESGEIEPGE